MFALRAALVSRFVICVLLHIYLSHFILFLLSFCFFIQVWPVVLSVAGYCFALQGCLGMFELCLCTGNFASI